MSRDFNSAVANAWIPGDWIVFSGLQGPRRRQLWENPARVPGDEGDRKRAIRATDDAQGDLQRFVRRRQAGVRPAREVDMNFWGASPGPDWRTRCWAALYR